MARSSSLSSSSPSSSESEPNEDLVAVSVAKLSPTVTEQHIRQIFSHFGNLGRITLKPAPRLNSSASIEFLNKQEAEIAVSNMNKGWIDGSRIVVELEDKSVDQNSSKRRNSGRRQPVDPRRKRIRRDHVRAKPRPKNSSSSSSSGVSSSESSSSSSSS